jgi:long-chain acyl-CoA synthetase
VNIAEYIDHGRREHPNRAAVVFEGKTISYEQCAVQADRAMAAFVEAGIAPGDRIALFMPNIPDFIFAYLGVLKAGAIAVSVNSGSRRNEVEYILRDSGARAIVAADEVLEEVPTAFDGRVFLAGRFGTSPEEARTETRAMLPHDPAVIVYTSGTTGQPKGATLSHENVVRNIQAKQRYLDIRSEDRALLFLPLYHCFGQNAVMNAVLHAGACLVLHRRFEMSSVLRSISGDGVTLFFGVPTTYRVLLDAPRNAFDGMRYFFSAAAPLAVEIEQRWEARFGKPIHQGYGLTETSPFASYNHMHQHRRGSIGTPIDGVEMKIVDPANGTEIPAGETGEIAIRGHNVMLGYWNRPVDTARVIRDGWLHTGDLGRVDSQGYFYIEDRLDDMINSGGVNVYPAEVESVLQSHPAVAEAAVYGVPEPLLSERVVADVVCRRGADVSEVDIRTFCRQRLTAAKTPAVIHFVVEIPKSATGKILKRVLRQRAAEAREESLDRKRVSRRDAERWIHDWLSANLPGFKLEPNCGAAFAAMGVDSVMAVQLALDLSEWLGREIAVTAAWSYPTIAALATHLGAREDAGRETATIEAMSNEEAEAALEAELEYLNR